MLLFKVSAIMPVYMGGNKTKLIYDNSEEEIVPKALPSVIKRNLKHIGCEYHTLVKYYASYIEKKQGVPLPISKDVVLMPVKVRKPIGKSDGAMGYINYHHIKEFKKRGSDTIITLKNGIEITCLQTFNSVKLSYSNASIVNKVYLNDNPK
ncbi:competence protein ComK [Natranaerobius trueperi]|uniref:Uncharacterized protein n=1 Tax=Natranaerobius trueperi TaxID=759412 RepID=A0A226BYM4_9FIRM|nr:competence protein ComK [Natranaerobius trueperi]OWZ83240.1 hypothetical protein CDO51_09685 [Natranaerobius trueperi]